MAKRHKPATVFAAIFTLIQAIVWAFLAIYSCAILECKVDFPVKPLAPDTPRSATLLFYTYFRGSCYRDTDLLLWSSPVAGRTYRWMVTYAIISCLWIPCAALLLGAAINDLRGKYILNAIYPWIFVTGVVLVCDLIATIVFAIDISQTLTVSSYKNFIGVGQDIPGLEGLAGVTVLPSVELTLFFSRFFIIFIINAVLFGVIIQVVRGIRSRTAISHYLNDNPYSSSTRVKEEMERPAADLSGGWINKAYVKSSGLQPTPRDRIPLGPLPVVRVYDEPTFIREIPDEEAFVPPPRLPPDYPPPHRPNEVDEPSSPVYDVSGRPLSWEQAAKSWEAPRNPSKGNTKGIDPTRPFTYLPNLPSKPKIHVSHANSDDENHF